MCAHVYTVPTKSMPHTSAIKDPCQPPVAYKAQAHRNSHVKFVSAPVWSCPLWCQACQFLPPLLLSCPPLSWPSLLPICLQVRPPSFLLPPLYPSSPHPLLSLFFHPPLPSPSWHRRRLCSLLLVHLRSQAGVSSIQLWTGATCPCHLKVTPMLWCLREHTIWFCCGAPGSMPWWSTADTTFLGTDQAPHSLGRIRHPAWVSHTPPSQSTLLWQAMHREHMRPGCPSSEGTLSHPNTRDTLSPIQPD